MAIGQGRIGAYTMVAVAVLLVTFLLFRMRAEYMQPAFPHKTWRDCATYLHRSSQGDLERFVNGLIIKHGDKALGDGVEHVDACSCSTYWQAAVADPSLVFIDN